LCFFIRATRRSEGVREEEEEAEAVERRKAGRSINNWLYLPYRVSVKVL